MGYTGLKENLKNIFERYKVLRSSLKYEKSNLEGKF